MFAGTDDSNEKVELLRRHTGTGRPGSPCSREGEKGRRCTSRHYLFPMRRRRSESPFFLRSPAPIGRVCECVRFADKSVGAIGSERQISASQWTRKTPPRGVRYTTLRGLRTFAAGCLWSGKRGPAPRALLRAVR